jgi:hypothetical protein
MTQQVTTAQHVLNQEKQVVEQPNSQPGQPACTAAHWVGAGTRNCFAERPLQAGTPSMNHVQVISRHAPQFTCHIVQRTLCPVNWCDAPPAAKL